MTAPGRVPWYIDAEARHRARTNRLLAYMAVNGQEGVLGADHLKLVAGGTPGAFVDVMPGAFSVLARHVGGAFEAYVDKIDEAVRVPVPATSATGRTDLLVLRILNPHVTEVGESIQAPVSPEDGPYWDIIPIMGVAAGTNNVVSVSPGWSAITLGLLTRPSNTGIVQAGHITQLRQVVAPRSITERIIIAPAENPPANPPPIAHDIWSGTKHLSAASTFASSVSTWTDWPSAAYWDVPIPSWATSCDIFGNSNPTYDGKLWGEARLNFGGNAGPATVYDEQDPDGLAKTIIIFGGSYAIPTSQRGKVVRVKMQHRNIDPGAHPGNLTTRNGVWANVMITFKREPS
jgi:hypothetical protein